MKEPIELSLEIEGKPIYVMIANELNHNNIVCSPASYSWLVKVLEKLKMLDSPPK
jgi:hypothetical protein